MKLNQEIHDSFIMLTKNKQYSTLDALSFILKTISFHKDSSELQIIQTKHFIIHELKSHNPFVALYLIHLPDNQKLIAKSFLDIDLYNNEQHGFHILRGTPLENKMRYPIEQTNDLAVLLFNYIEGIDLLEGICKKVLPEELIWTIYHEAIELKKRWWSSQTKISPGKPLASVSHIHWEERMKQVKLTCVLYARIHSLTLKEWLATPIFCNKEIPGYSLEHIIEVITKELTKPLDYAVITHGDLHFSNILVNSDTKQWLIIDPEHANYGDPAESYVQQTKAEVIHTASQVLTREISYKNGQLIIQCEVEFPSIVKRLQDAGLTHAKTMGKALKDDDFMRRYWLYQTAVYLRDIEQAKRKNRADLELFAMVRTIESFHMFQCDHHASPDSSSLT